jgi:putative two-component system response regulator
MDKILFVDDEQSVLNAINRALRGKFKVFLAGSAEAGLSLLVKEGPFALVVSDFQMPGMDGADFLAEVSRIAPDTVRMMLTGCAEFETSLRAVNEGSIFRFLTKPCQIQVLEKAIRDGIHQYELVQTARDYYAMKKWNESMGGLIQAFVRLIESKDPYTAGHQHRVAEFSCAIAENLGFTVDQVEELKMAAMVHDIGKIYVPVEFLNKPGRLNQSEWNIIKMHAQIGCDILESIKFPFPLHTIVLQHHERIDGSGYPNGLTGPDILVQSKIIAVADITEAVAHHRPYRPAKGISKAIGILKGYRGIQLDAVITDAALNLLVEGKFQFKKNGDNYYKLSAIRDKPTDE